MFRAMMQSIADGVMERVVEAICEVLADPQVQAELDRIIAENEVNE